MPGIFYRPVNRRRFLGHSAGALALLAYLASVNLLVLFFNLIPAFPLDGGRIARAIAWWRTGDRERATRFAAVLGRGLGYLLIAFGLYSLLTPGGGTFGGLWTAVPVYAAFFLVVMLASVGQSGCLSITRTRYSASFSCLGGGRASL